MIGAFPSVKHCIAELDGLVELAVPIASMQHRATAPTISSRPPPPPGGPLPKLITQQLKTQLRAQLHSDPWR